MKLSFPVISHKLLFFFVRKKEYIVTTHSIRMILHEISDIVSNLTNKINKESIPINQIGVYGSKGRSLDAKV